MKLYLDMDGVIADFITGACDALGIDDPWVKDPNTSHECLREALGYDSMESFYEDVHGQDFGKQVEFWANLPKLPHANRIISEVTRIFGENIFLLSSPSVSSNGCMPGKIKWIEKHFPQFLDKFAFTKCKWAFAHDDAILLDDFALQTKRFEEAGGYSILCPARNNVNRKKLLELQELGWLPMEIARVMQRRIDDSPKRLSLSNFGGFKYENTNTS